MPISLRDPKGTASTECLLHHEPLLTPPVSTLSDQDSPFKPRGEDDIAPSAKGGGHDIPVRPVGVVRRAFHHSDQDIPAIRRRRRRYRKTNQWRMSLRKFRSAPLLQPRFEPGEVELLPGVISRQSMPLWTIPPKAGATRGLASVIPVTSAVDEHLAPHRNIPFASPAMITLRRATTTRRPRRMSMTFFPPPKFNQTSSGFPWSIIESLREGNDNPPTISRPPKATAEVWPRRAGSEPNGTMEERHRRASIASVVYTELIPSQAGGTSLEVDQSIDSTLRQCTRYTSDRGVYEILWDAETSLEPWDGLRGYHNESKSTMDRRHSLAVDELEMQLLKAREQSRRASLRVPVMDASSLEDDGLDNQDDLAPSRVRRLLQVKLAKLANNDQLRNLPRSKASRKAEAQTPLPTRSDVVGVVTSPPMEPFTVHGDAELIKPVDCVGSEVLGRDPEESSGVPIEPSVNNVQHLCISPLACTQYPLTLHGSNNSVDGTGLADNDLGQFRDQNMQTSKTTHGWVPRGENQNGWKKKVIRTCNI